MSCIARAGWLSGMLSAVKLCQSSSISGPGRDGKAQVGEDFGQFVHHLADRVDRALAAHRARAASGRSSRAPAALPAPRASERLPCDRQAPRQPLRAGVDLAGPGSGALRAIIPPSVFSSAETQPCLPSNSTRSASSASRISPPHRCAPAPRSVSGWSCRSCARVDLAGYLPPPASGQSPQPKP